MKGYRKCEVDVPNCSEMLCMVSRGERLIGRNRAAEEGANIIYLLPPGNHIKPELIVRAKRGKRA